MPNIGGHLYAASEVLGDVSGVVKLGTITPDFIAMYNDRTKAVYRVGVRGLDPNLDIGMDFHQRTDIVFNSRSEFIQAAGILQGNLEASGLEPRAAKLSAHLLSKIMGDIVLLTDTARREIVADTTTQALGALNVFDKMPQRGLADYIWRYFDDDTPANYSNSSWLARLAYRRLARRAEAQPWKTDRTIWPQDIKGMTEAIASSTEATGTLALEALNRTIEILRSQ